MEKLSLEELDAVSGGRYVINGNTHQVAFRDVRQVFQLKNCSDYDAMAAMDSLVGIYGSEEEYDNACIALLQSKGWI